MKTMCWEEGKMGKWEPLLKPLSREKWWKKLETGLEEAYERGEPEVYPPGTICSPPCG